MLPSTMVLQTTPPSEHCWGLTPRNAPDALPTLAQRANVGRASLLVWGEGGESSDSPKTNYRCLTIGSQAWTGLHERSPYERSSQAFACRALAERCGLAMVRSRKTFLGCARYPSPGSAS